MNIINKILRKNSSRVLLEDILKYLFTSEVKDKRAEQKDIADFLKKSITKIHNAVKILQQDGLVDKSDKGVVLTAKGRGIALAQVRKHRLYEKYLAEQTGYDENQWHLLAEEKEHQISDVEYKKIIHTIGDARFDPHGSPIPTEKGELPEISTLNILDADGQSAAKVARFEDEPVERYKKIIGLNISIGTIIRNIEVRSGGVSFELLGNNINIDLETAQNIYIVPVNVTEDSHEELLRLVNLKIGQEAHIVRISSKCKGANRRRLLDLGFVKGSKVKIDLESPSGNPVAYEIRGTAIALRNDQAQNIYITQPIDINE